MKEKAPGAKKTKVSMTALPLSGYMTLNSLLDFAEPLFPYP